jgi:hypothetical protein
VIAAKHKEVFRVANLECEHETYCFDALAPAVNVIAEEEIIRFRWILTQVKEAEKIVILTVNISTYRDWWLKFEQGWLAEVYLPYLLAQPDNLEFGETSRRSKGAIFNSKKLLNDCFRRHLGNDMTVR